MSKNRTGYGRSKAVKRDDQSMSGLDLVACDPCNTKQDCEDVIVTEVPATTEVRGIMVDEKEHLFDKVYKINDPLLKSAIDYVAGHYEVSPKYVCAEYADGKHTINHIGEHTFGNLTGTDGGELSGTIARNCKYVEVCDTGTNVPFGLADKPVVAVTLEDGTTTTKTLTGDYSDGDNPSGLQAELEPCIDGTVTVTVDAGGFYVVKSETQGNPTITIAGKGAVTCSCEHKFVPEA